MVVFILVLLGLCFGSFTNAFVWRMHTKKDWVRARSVCVHCKHILAPKDLVPVLSWIWLNGKCRYCHKPISWQYPIVELSTALLFVLSYYFWPSGFDTKGLVLFIFWLIFLTGFIALAVYDIRWMLLPNKIVYPLLLLAVLQLLITLTFFHGGLTSIVTALWGIAIGGGIFYLIFQVSGGRWIGGGDVKLGSLLGIILGGPELTILMLFFASYLGSLVTIPLLLSGKASRTSKLPFGPFLMAAAIIVRLIGPSIVSWYKHRII